MFWLYSRLFNRESFAWKEMAFDAVICIIHYNFANLAGFNAPGEPMNFCAVLSDSNLPPFAVYVQW